MNRKTILCLALAAAISVGCAAPVSAIDSAGLSALQSMGVIQGNTNAAATRGEFARMLVAAWTPFQQPPQPPRSPTSPITAAMRAISAPWCRKAP